MVTREDVLQMARLSKLYIKEEELDALTKDMDNIIAFAETISAAQCEQTLIISTISLMYYGKTLWFLLTTEKKF